MEVDFNLENLFVRASNASSSAPSSSRSKGSDNLMQFNVVRGRVSKAQRIRDRVTPPIERSGHRMLCDKNYVYVIGGFCPFAPSQLIQEIWRFNILTDEWELMDVDLENFPAEMASFALCAEENSDENDFRFAFLFGGTTVPFGEESSNSVTVLKRTHSGSFTWEKLKTTGHMPRRQYGSSIMLYRGKLFLIGGTTGHEYNFEVRSLTPPMWVTQETDRESGCWKWELLNDGENLHGRYRHEVVVVGDEIVVVGGGTPQWAPTLETLPVFNITSKEFRKQNTVADDVFGYPSPRMCHGCVYYQKKIYIIGGCSEKKPVRIRRAMEEVVDVFDDFWELCTVTWKWRKCPAVLRQPTCFHGATVTQDGCIYVFGGSVNGLFTRRTNVLQRIWLQPPSLRLLSYRAFIAAHPEILENSEGDIIFSRSVELLHKIFAVRDGSPTCSNSEPSSWLKRIVRVFF